MASVHYIKSKNKAWHGSDSPLFLQCQDLATAYYLKCSLTKPSFKPTFKTFSDPRGLPATIVGHPWWVPTAVVWIAQTPPSCRHPHAPHLDRHHCRPQILGLPTCFKVLAIRNGYYPFLIAPQRGRIQATVKCFDMSIFAKSAHIRVPKIALRMPKQKLLSLDRFYKPNVPQK